MHKVTSACIVKQNSHKGTKTERITKKSYVPIAIGIVSLRLRGKQ
ncbi:MAG: hypothetical protein ABIQ07_06760 [Ginsengibacter sp.]